MAEQDQQVDTVFRALADSTRRMILDELMSRDDQTLFEICVRLIDDQQLSITRQAISKHLAVLEDAGLVQTSWQGRTKLHSLNSTPVRQLGAGWLARYLKKSGRKK